MKRFLILFLVVAALLLALPGVVGFQAESQYRALVERLAQSGLERVDDDYRRGWFSATATTRFRVPASAAGQSQPFEFTLVSRLDHGPLTADGLALMRIDSQFRVDGQPLFSGDYPAQIRTRVGFDGAGQTLVELPATRLPARPGRPDIRFDGLSGTVDFSLREERVELRARAAGLAIAEPQKLQIELGEMRIDSRSRRGRTGLMIGSGELALRSMRFVDPNGGGVVELEGFSVKAASNERDRQIDGIVLYRLQRLLIGDAAYGPGELGIEMTQLPAAPLLELQQSLERIQRQRLDDEQRSAAVAAALAGLGPELLAGDPGIAIDPVRLQTPDGLVSGRFTLRPVGLRWEELSNIGAVIAKLTADFELRMPEVLFQRLQQQQIRLQLLQQIALLQQQQGEEARSVDPQKLDALIERQAQQRFEQWLAQGVIERDGGDIGAVASLSSGLLTVNGKSYPLAALLQQPAAASEE